MATKLFVNIPVGDLNRSMAFFTGLGFEFHAMANDMASVIISEHTQVMLLTEAAFTGYARHRAADPNTATEVILVLGLETRDQVDELVDKAVAGGGGAVGAAREEDGRYQRAFTDPDGHHWEALCLLGPGA